MSRIRLTAVFSLAIVFILSFALSLTPVSAATFTVNDAGDAGDASPGDGTCATAGAVCTLRAAIQEANALAGDDIIDFSAVTLVNIATELSITSNITINGSGVTVDNTGTGRVFNITSGTVVIDGLTVTGGGGVSIGGGILIDGASSDLRLQGGAVVTGNAASLFTGGVHAGNGAQLTVTGSGTAITANTAGAIGAGGIGAVTGADVFLLAGATVSSHTGSTGLGSGIALDGAGTTLLVDNASVIGNTGAGNGGGIFAQQGASITLQNGAVVSQNVATGDGGGINMNTSAGTLTVTNSRITFNSAGGDGDAIFQSGGSTSVSNSCIVCNDDDAIRRTGGTIPMALGDNWWGSDFGPYYSPSTEGLQCSLGDSISPLQTLANMGITVTTPSASCATPAVGNWLTAATAGCTGTEISGSSGIGRPRVCTPP